IAFDMLLTPAGKTLIDEPLHVRRQELERFFRDFRVTADLKLSPRTESRSSALRWLAQSGGALDGVIAKPVEEPYHPGERTMMKVKQRRTADCIVGGFRYGEGTRFVASLLLGLYDTDGKLHHVGFTSTIRNAER